MGTVTEDKQVTSLRNPECDLCTLNTGAKCPKNPCLMPAMEDITPHDVMIVAEQPLVNDDLYGRIFAGKGLGEIRKYLEDAGLSVYCTYGLKCPRPDKNTKPTAKAMKACFPEYIRKEIELVKPKHIITLGSNAFYAATGTKPGGERPTGGRYYVEKLDAHLYPTIHNLQATYNQQAKNTLFADLARFVGWITGTAKQSLAFDPPVYVADTLKSLRTLQRRIRRAGGVVAVDTETQGLNPYVYGKHVRCIQFCWDTDFGGVFVPLKLEKDCYYTDEDNLASFWDKGETLEEAVEIIREILLESRCIWHNGKFDRLWLYLWGLREFGEPILAPNIEMDTLHTSHIINENRVLKLKQLITSELGYVSYDIPNKLTKDLDVLIPYATKDTVSTLMLAYKNGLKLKQDDWRKVRKLYTGIIRPMDDCFTEIELRGWPVDADRCRELRKLVRKEFKRIDRKLHELLLEEGIVLGTKVEVEETTRTYKSRPDKVIRKEVEVPPSDRDIRLMQKHGLDYAEELGITISSKTFASPQKLAVLIFDILGYPMSSDKRIAYTETKARSTKEDALVHLRGKPILDTLLEWREHAKMLNTYVDPLLEAAEARGRFTTSYKLTGTVTGRTASGKEEGRARSKAEESGRNGQNWPYGKYGPDKLSVRHCVKARKGWVIMEADFSQVELRVAGHLSQDPLFLKAYSEDADIHAIRGMRVAGYTPETWALLPKEKQKELRQKAKAVNFGFLYGMSAHKFQQYALTDYNLHLTYKECVDLREQFFNDHRGLEKWYARQEREAIRKGFVESLSGRRRHLPNVQMNPETSKETKMRIQEAIRMAINTPVQGFASDMKLMSIIEIMRNLKSREAQTGEEVAYIFGEVHDSIVLEVREDVLPEIAQMVLDVMAHPKILDDMDIVLTVPIKAEIKAGPSWGEAQDYHVPMAA